VSPVRVCPFCLLPLATECICDDAQPAAGPPPFDCGACQDTGHVCESHPSRPWGGFCCDGPAEPGEGGVALCEHGACHCGGAGMPCTACCSPIPADGRHSITEAFTPDRLRARTETDDGA
jgi:hypothetical protein